MKSFLSFKSVIITIALGALLVSPSLAANDAGAAGAFMRFGSSARSLSLGSAMSAYGDGAGSSYWNPGGLSQMRTTEVLVMGADLFADTRYSYFSCGVPTEGKNVYAFSGTYVTSGEYEEADIYHDLGNTFSESEGVFAASFARGGSRFGYGVTAKSVNQQINGISGSGFGIDAGLYLRPDRRLSFGMSLQNAFQPKITLDQYPEKMARTLRSGIAMHLFSDRLLVLSDYVKIESSGSYFSGGVEVTPTKNLILRAGYDSLHEQTGFGAGIRYGKWQVDFAQLSHDLGSTTVLSAIMRFGLFDRVDIKSDRTQFSPSGSERSVDYHITTAIRGSVEKWEILMTNKAGELVRIIEGDGHPPSVVTWNGDNDQGRLINEGNYLATVTIIDDLGDSWSSSTDVSIHGFNNRTKTPMRIDVSGSKNKDKQEDK